MVRAENGTLAGVLEGKKQYLVPLYQRVYSWGPKQLGQIWEDVTELGETLSADARATHFIGSLVLAASPDMGALGVNKYLVVDGQQRLTTLTLLLAALRDHLRAEGEDEQAEGIDADYLINTRYKGKPHKVVPTQSDRDSYEAVINASPSAGGEDNVGQAYRFFRSRIAALASGRDELDYHHLEAIIASGLALVVVTAEPSDNAHRIFESLNNTGLRLTQSDLLKNYLFMRMGDRADDVYRTVWLPLEKRLTSLDLELLFWLDLVQRDERAKQSETYVGQQRRLEKLLTPDEVEAEVRRIAALGDVLATILAPETERNPQISRRLARIKAWGSTTAYPVVMQLLARRAAGTATDVEVARALTYLESYFVRRVVTGRAGQGQNRALLQSVAAISEAEGVDEALRDYLSRGRRHFATDSQIREAVKAVPFYWQGRGQQKKLILQWLEEAYRPKEIVSIDPKHLTIEHVLPQTMTEDVRDTFGAEFDADADISYEHERIVHTLGNLTLTGYNSELSNKPFEQKRELLAASGLFMNQTIAVHEHWGAAEINMRGDALAEKIIELWPGPDEDVAVVADDSSELRGRAATVVAEIPAGRWTTYGDLAIVLGTWAQPLANVISTYPMANAWRVLQAGGKISPGFKWSEPGREDDPVEVLKAEGVQFDDASRASSDQFIDAEELALAAGLEVDAEGIAARRKRVASKSGGRTITRVKEAQQAFYERVRDYGRINATHIRSLRAPRPQSWYEVTIGDSRCYVVLQINSVKKCYEVRLQIPDDEALFAALYVQREAIESDLGFEVDWVNEVDRKVSSLFTRGFGNFLDEEDSPRIVEWLINRADAFARVIPKYL